MNQTVAITILRYSWNEYFSRRPRRPVGRAILFLLGSAMCNFAGRIKSCEKPNLAAVENDTYNNSIIGIYYTGVLQSISEKSTTAINLSFRQTEDTRFLLQLYKISITYSIHRQWRIFEWR